MWQCRFRGHQIRDESDCIRRAMYVHHNPVKHNLVWAPNAWAHTHVLGDMWKLVCIPLIWARRNRWHFLPVLATDELGFAALPQVTYELRSTQPTN